MNDVVARAEQVGNLVVAVGQHDLLEGDDVRLKFAQAVNEDRPTLVPIPMPAPQVQRGDTHLAHAGLLLQATRRLTTCLEDGVLQVGSELPGSHLRALPVAGDALFPGGPYAEGGPGEVDRFYGLWQPFVAGLVEPQRIAQRDYVGGHEELARYDRVGVYQRPDRDHGTGSQPGPLKDRGPGGHVASGFDY